MNVDKLYQAAVGELGWQQMKYVAVIFIYNLYGAFQMLQYKFAAAEPKTMKCITGEADEFELNQCPHGLSSNCKHIDYGLQSHVSVVTEFDLVCERAWLGPLTMSLFMMGVMFGAIAMGPMADMFGRRRMLSVCFLGLLAFNSFGAFATNFLMYGFFRMICGFFQSGAIIASFVLMNELIGASYRGVVSVVLQAFFAIGVALLSLLAYTTQNSWTTLTICISAMGIPLLFLFQFYVPESPMWLVGQKRHQEAVSVLKLIAAGNGRKWEDDLEAYQQPKTDKKAASDDDRLVHLITNNQVSHLTMIQMYSWFANSATYYGLTLAAGDSSDSNSDIYASTAMSGLVEIPAYILTNFLLPKYGRRKTLVLFMVSGGLSCFAICLVSYVPVLKDLGITISLAMLGKLCISASFAVVYIHSNEIFPTSIRNGGMGIVSFCARMGGVLSPYLAKLGNVVPNLHFIMFGLFALTSGMLNAKLPETNGRPLPDTLEDLIVRGGEHSPTRDKNYVRLSTEEG